MTPFKEIGESVISDGDSDYFFRPSFAAMTKIGDPQEIVQAFYDLHNDEATPLLTKALEAYGYVPAWLIKFIGKPQFSRQAIMAAMKVLVACCDRDPVTLIGEIVPGKSGKWAFVYRKGKMELLDMILVAQSLMTHGVIGKAKIRQLQRHEAGEATSEFKAIEYISSARNHFGMSRAEAEQLTMTEFTMLIANKYPDQKGYTREEYDQAADDFFERRKRRLAKRK